MSKEKAIELLRAAETKCLCTDDRLRPLKEIRAALAELAAELAKEPEVTEMSRTDEIQYLGLMLTATTSGDEKRLAAIIKRLQILQSERQVT